MNTRDLITEAAKSLRIDSQVKLLEPHRYQGILERIIANRTTLGKGGTSALWWWESLREPVAYIQPKDTISILKALIRPEQPIWFVAEAGEDKKHGNFWLYESDLASVCLLLQDLPFFEFYLVSRKCDWLVCENHHGHLIASGEAVASRLSSMKAV